MHRLIVCNPEKCLGCNICEFVCSAVKEECLDSSHSRIHVVNFEPIGSVALPCVFCKKPACVTACPRKALYQNEKAVIQVDEKKCNGCGWCIRACEFGAITMHPLKKTVMVCDLCDGEPECVEACPFEGALTWVTRKEVAPKFRRGIIINFFQEPIGKSKRSG